MDLLIDHHHHLYLASFCRNEVQHKVALLSQTRPERALDKIGFSTGWVLTQVITMHYNNDQHVFSLQSQLNKLNNSGKIRARGFFLSEQNIKMLKYSSMMWCSMWWDQKPTVNHFNGYKKLAADGNAKESIIKNISSQPVNIISHPWLHCHNDECLLLNSARGCGFFSLSLRLTFFSRSWGWAGGEFLTQ